MRAVDDERETEYRHQLLSLCRYVHRHGQRLPPGAQVANLTIPSALATLAVEGGSWPAIYRRNHALACEMRRRKKSSACLTATSRR